MAILVTGITGYMIIEGYTFFQAFYMTTITVTTTGFESIRPFSDAGRVFTTFLLIASWASFAFALARITQFVTSGEINKYFKTRKLMKGVDKLDGHVIICGYGRNGQQAGLTLKIHNVPFVVIERNEERMEKVSNDFPDLLALLGDATDDEVLKRAGIHRAKALITALPDDADNVIMPDRIGGTHMATLVSKPDVIEFIDFLSGEEGEPIHIESVDYRYLPVEIRDRSLKDVMNWKKTGVNCIGIKDTEGKFVTNPPEDVLIGPGTKVIVLGTKWQIDEMKENLH